MKTHILILMIYVICNPLSIFAQSCNNPDSCHFAGADTLHSASGQETSRIKSEEIFSQIEKYIQNNLPKRAVQYAGESLIQFPNNQKLLNKYCEMVFWYSGQKLAEKIFSELVEKYSNNYTFYIELAFVYFCREKYSASLSVLEKLADLSKFPPDCRYYYLLADNYFGLEQDTTAAQYYQSVLECLDNRAEADIFYHDLCYIMSDEEFLEYETLEPVQFKDFYHRFWLSRDPDLSTSFNERLGEHYRRLMYARKHYRRFVAGESFLEMDDNWSNTRTAGDKLIGKYQTRALPRNRELDDMGLIYVRHGNPDNWMFYVCASCDQNFSWQYYRTHQRPELIFHFAKGGGVRGWIISTLPLYFQNRWDLGIRYASLDPTVAGNDIESLEAMSYMLELAVENEKHVQVAMHEETTDFKFEQDPLNFSMRILCFKAPDRKILVKFYYGVDGNLAKMDAVSGLKLGTFWGIYNDQWRQIIYEKQDKTYTLGHISQAEWQKSSIILNKQAIVHPGDYHLEFR
ncbi:GWxTD domain-containing protein [candidate division KSB1 bacterium]|nr:GWxTD domain-containing protein [candidate division KSB1 bacterium]